MEGIYRIYASNGYIHKTLVGYEMLARNWGSIQNENLFPFVPTSVDRELFLLHINNLTERSSRKDLFYFVNVKPQTLLEYFYDLFYCLPHGRIVFEIREDYLDREQTLRVRDLRENHLFLLSIDDFGSGASNFDRVKLLNPNFVKVEVPLFDHQELKSIVSMLRRSFPHAHLIAEKVETEEDFHKAQLAGFFFYQGWLFENEPKG